MRTTLNVSFYCRRSKADRNGQAPVEISLIINGTRKFINMPFKCSPDDFKKKRKPKYIQDYLDTQRVKVATILSDMATEGIPLTADALRDYFRSGGIRSYTINDLFNDYFKLLNKRYQSGAISSSVYDKYVWVRKLFSSHMDFNKECSAITPSTIQDFYITLQDKYQDSTSSGYMTKLKTIIRYGMDNNRIKINPFQNIRVNKGTKDIVPLVEEEVTRIMNKDLSRIPRLEKVKDLFVFSCFTGLAYVDTQRLKPEDIMEQDGTYYINKERAKTKVKFMVVLLPEALAILKKYDWKLPHLSNQHVNGYLNEIQELCGIEKHLHFHLARHTAACMYLNKYKFKAEVTAKVLGHSLTQTQHYQKMFASTVFEAFESITNK